VFLFFELLLLALLPFVFFGRRQLYLVVVELLPLVAGLGCRFLDVLLFMVVCFLLLRVELFDFSLAPLSFALLASGILRLFLGKVCFILLQFGAFKGLVVFKVDEGVVVGLTGESQLKHILLQLMGVEHILLFLLDLVFGIFVENANNVGVVFLLLLDELFLLTTI